MASDFSFKLDLTASMQAFAASISQLILEMVLLLYADPFKKS